ncbi:MAG: phosphoglycerate dehydrogenase [Candidatus Magnetoovum sp. WYHC-5]|nr:phosphoglycerate dehydrogenase [Candidatus Magnetoovum sp. WYHC-5]
MKVLVSDNISAEGIDILRKGGLEVDVKVGMSLEELTCCIDQYNGIIIRSATKVTKEVIDSAKNLMVIGRAGSGLDNVDKVAASKKGIVVMNTPGGNTITTAEHTIAMMFALIRKTPLADRTLKNGKWEKKKLTGIELYNKTLGIVGLGNIGVQVAKKALGLEMNVIGYDPFISEEQAKKIGIRKVTLETLFKQSHIITVHTPLTNETRNMINKDTIALMKDGVRIINCARGGIVNEKDLYDAIKSGKVAGAAIDVFEKEPPDDYSLVSLDEVVCTPHLGASTVEAQENVALAVCEQIVDYLINGTIRNAVNFPSIPSEQVMLLKPYLDLAEKMGAFASQVHEGVARKFDIKLIGEAAEIASEPVKIAALKGFLTPMLEETVNFVNAPVIAKERGIEVNETKSKDITDYNTMIGIIINGKFEIYGTLFGRKEPRIIMIKNYHIDVIPSGTMLFITNNDVPGIIGNIGTIIGQKGINIARMTHGRDRKGGVAITVVSLDGDIDAEAINAIKGLSNIVSVKKVIVNSENT